MNLSVSSTPSSPVTITLNEPLARLKNRFETLLPQWLHPSDLRLAEAVRYSLLGGGKRIRPLLVYATAAALGLPPEAVDPLAAAIEMIHAYSLIHDDLPAMDNDELRRGLPTCHLQFDEATAILAGDALQCRAFELLAEENTYLTPARQLRMILQLSKASGLLGMVGGQSLDLEAEGQSISETALERIHRHKTGALIQACVLCTVIAAGLEQHAEQPLFAQFAAELGLAFQIRDDILDIEASTALLGKPQGSDAAQQKATYPLLLGLAGAKQKLENVQQQLSQRLSTLNFDTSLLRFIMNMTIYRPF